MSEPMSEEQRQALGAEMAQDVLAEEDEDNQAVEDEDVVVPTEDLSEDDYGYSEIEDYNEQESDDSEGEWEYQEPEPDDFEPDESLSSADRAILAERKQRLKAEKKLAWVESEALKTRRQNWVQKESKFYPLADTKALAAESKSRKEFVRKAKAEHERMKVALAPHIEAARAQAKEEVRQAWGRPTSGPGVPSESMKASAEIEEARQKGGLIGVVKARLLKGDL